MGLSTAISNSNVDAFGASIRPEQIGKLKRMRRWNSTSDSNNKAYSRNLIKAFAIMARIKDKLSLSDSVIEGACISRKKAG
jgi:transcription initiation factor TFIIB